MLKIDDNFLQSLGLGDLPLEEKDLLISEIYQQLELRVGTRLAEGLSEQQQEEFEQLMHDEAAALKWLQANVPHYPAVVKEELDRLQVELKNQSHQIKQAIKDQPPAQQAA